MTIRVIDLETTGTDPAKDGICEIASVDLTFRGDRAAAASDDQYDITNMLQHMVNPGRPIPPEATAVHHILDEDVAHARTIQAIIAEYANADAYVAHKADFERGFLQPLLGDVVWVCTHRIALRLWPDAPGHSNQTLRYWLGIKEPFGRKRDTIAPHRALSDVVVTAALLTKMIGKAPWGDMVRWSAEPPLLTFCKFGTKHKGKRFEQIAVEDPSYLTWIIDKSELDADTKWNAEYWLRQRETRTPPAKEPERAPQLL